MGQHLSSLSNFSCTFHLMPCYSHAHHFLFLMLASLCAPGYLLASESLSHLETASFFLSMAILAPPCSLESQGASFHLLSVLSNKKMGSFLPVTASAAKHYPSFQSHSSYSNGLAWTEREGWSGTECAHCLWRELWASLHSLLPALATALSNGLYTGLPASGIWLDCKSFPSQKRWHYLD